jgi:hypothetical protein
MTVFLENLLTSEEFSVVRLSETPGVDVRKLTLVGVSIAFESLFTGTSTILVMMISCALKFRVYGCQIVSYCFHSDLPL